VGGCGGGGVASDPSQGRGWRHPHPYCNSLEPISREGAWGSAREKKKHGDMKKEMENVKEI